MTDYFQLLEQPRRPWLDEAQLKESFQKFAAIQHPDAAATGDAGQFAALNGAYLTLREPALRLRHLLELEGGLLASTAPIPTALADLFMELAGARSQLDRFLLKESAASPLAKAVLGIEKAALRKSWGLIRGRIGAAKESAMERLREFDSHWAENGPDCETLGALQQEFAYLSRWEAQLREALLALEL